MPLVRILRFSPLVLMFALLVLLSIAGTDGPPEAEGAFGVSDPIPGAVDRLAIDVDTTGNTPNSVASVQTCREVSVGQIFTLDIVVDEIPPYNQQDSYSGVNGMTVDLLYTPGPNGLRVTSRGVGSDVGWFQSGPGTYFDSPSNFMPDNDGDYRHEATELGALVSVTESGEMVMAHLTVEILGPSVNILSLDDLLDGDFVANVLTHDSSVYPTIGNFPGTGPVALAYLVPSGSGGCADPDADNVPEIVDNCDSVANADQLDFDSDSEGNACDLDDDSDGIADASDECNFTALSVTIDANGCSQSQVDGDLDGVCNPARVSTHCSGSDDCPGTIASPVDSSGCSQIQVDADLDGVCDPTRVSTHCIGSDNCPTAANTNQTNTDVVVAPPGDGLGDACDPDDDNDGSSDSAELASAGVPTGNILASDPLNPASTPEVCDNLDNDLNEGFDEGYPNNDGDTLSGHYYADCVDPDDDNDFFPDSGDNCQFVFNITQTDFDMDGQGDACDDYDGDGVMDDTDNCRVASNPDQANTDVIVSPPGDALGDVCDSEDDGDGVLDPFDNCTMVPNPLQEDIDADGTGDACDDSDGDSIVDRDDNCYAVQNTDQAEHDADGTGDACDPEDDGDGIFDGIDGTWNGSAFASQSTVFSDAFTDQHLGGVSHGSIIDRGGIYVQVSDLTLEGFLLWGIGTGMPSGTVDVCNETQIVIGGGSIATAACTNSTVIRVIAGSVSARAGNLVAGLPVGANVIVEEFGQGYSIENTAGSAANISVNGTQLPPGSFDEDNDNDGYLTTRENFVGTLPGVGCAATLTPLDEDPDAGPRDNNDDRRINLSDISRFSAHYNSPTPVNSNYNVRFDLSGDGRVNLSDISLMSSGYNTMCTP